MKYVDEVSEAMKGAGSSLTSSVGHGIGDCIVNIRCDLKTLGEDQNLKVQEVIEKLAKRSSDSAFYV